MLAIPVVEAQNTNQPPHKVLFIGDSLTYYQGGIYTHLEKLAAAARLAVSVTADKSVFGGAFLRRLWDLQAPVNAIGAGAYDAVVLQEDLPETNIADFHEYARRFVAEIRKTRARPILLMAWAYPRLGWISMEQIASAHRDAARELSEDVAPVALVAGRGGRSPDAQSLCAGPRAPEHSWNLSRDLRRVCNDLRAGSERSRVRRVRRDAGRGKVPAEDRLANGSGLQKLNGQPDGRSTRRFATI
jgi:hypothetical protein